MKDIIAFLIVCAVCAGTCFAFSIVKDREIGQMIKAGSTPVYHDFLVQTALMGAGIVFLGIGIVAIVGAIVKSVH